MPAPVLGQTLIRTYAAPDCDALIELFRLAVRQTAPADYSQDQVLAWAPDEIDRANWQRRRTCKPTWVAEIDGKIAGFMDLEADGHIDMAYVHPACQRLGVATALLSFVERAARMKDIKRLYTEASITARPFFEHRGFRVLSRQTVMLRGQAFLNYRMEKQLE